MPMDDSQTGDDQPREESQRVIARTLLRTFLATPPLTPTQARDCLTASVFLPEYGNLAGINASRTWMPVREMLRAESVVIPLPEMEDVLRNYPGWMVKSTAAMVEMLGKPLGIGPASCKLGRLGVKPAGPLKWITPNKAVGHVIIIEQCAYQAIAESMCTLLADAEKAAQLLEVGSPALYRDALMPPLSHMHPDRSLPGEWSEMRDIVSNMLAASHYSAEKLDLLYDRAKRSDNFGFMALVEQRKKQLLKEQYRMGADTPSAER